MKLNLLIPTDNDIEITGVNYNSHQIKPGEVFVAIKGFKTDGHDHALEAQQNGASCVVCEREISGLEIPCILVENSRIALAEIAHKFYGEPAKKMEVIGITGTNGKTTVTYLVKSILEKCGEKVGLIGTNQNMIGNIAFEAGRTTPESLDLVLLFKKMADAGCKYAVMEVSSHSLALERVHGTHFSVGAFTNLTQDHLDFHKTMENYLAAKAKLFQMCDIAVINVDDPYGKRLLETITCPVITYGLQDADIKAVEIETDSSGVSFKCDGEDISLGIPGKFSVYNALTAIGICKALGVKIGVVSSALKSTEGVKGRVEVVPTGKDFTLLIDYAHTPDGLQNVLESVRENAKGRVVALFGCGGDRDTSKRPKMGKIAGELADFCIITSDNPRSEDPAAIIRDILSGMKDASAEYIVVENRRDAIEYALTHAQKDDVIVLAGKGHETYQILADNTIHFDEREVVSEILSKN